uniref:Uncharacterized protein n=1 Tax=Propithecus coquereli TaxID=379532 RepID=A0A2K6ELV0_PROCO
MPRHSSLGNREDSVSNKGKKKELWMAVKQGNQLQMQVHEGRHVADEAPAPVMAEKRLAARAGKKPLAHYSSLVRVLGSDMKTPEEPAAQLFPLAPCDTDQPQDKPPDWFTSYLETFREQVVKETVEKLEQKLHEKLVLQNPSLGSCPSEVSMPISEETLFWPENQFSWITSSSCLSALIPAAPSGTPCTALHSRSQAWSEGLKPSLGLRLGQNQLRLGRDSLEGRTSHRSTTSVTSS